MPVIIIHEGKRLAIHGSLSRALRRMRLYPVGAAIVDVRTGRELAIRMHRDWYPTRINSTPGAGVGGYPDEAVPCL
jgi:hypothetical protein